ncbi:UV DNA damage repair endonuclease UvsE [Nostoc sp. MS1]|uniref:UV DNA damage repair endonuclease UvsE n=1 Tax=Nostoc sp. MS1 TaxID=2764711 RepID=UPI001CC34306|nr:UV DNA damage repair endonuclease UvsE [Nostoc sp. MS1]BCL35718.1 UV DNA damage endonuclease [Nostoc sp. MS1]
MAATQLNNLPSTVQLAENTQPELGLVCITFDKQVRFRTMTRTRYLQLSLSERESGLREIYLHNLQRLHDALTFCQNNNIRLYRIPSGVFPLSDMEDQIGAKILAEINADLGQIGIRAQSLNIRMVLHPDQFVVLSSDSSEVVKNSIKILEDHAHIFDLLGLPRSPWSLMNIHGGKSQRSEQLVKVIANLPENIKNRLTLENDEYAYSAEEIFTVCQQAKIPMVFDAHHHICHENLDSYDDSSVTAMFNAARETWAKPEWQLVHISNGEQAFKDRKHSNLITDMPSVYRQAPWIEVEAKQKEAAIAHLRSWWLMGE